MASVQLLLDDINLLYRNTYTTAQKIVWMNEVQNDLFEIIEVDSDPYSITLSEGVNLYDNDPDIYFDRIKTLTIQVNDADPPTFQELPFKRNDNNERVSVTDYWYTIVGKQYYFNIPGGTIGGRLVYIYLDAAPVALTAGSIGMEPSVPPRYQELLKLGVLRKIAGARKDVMMRNNYDMEYQQKIEDLILKKLSEPEWTAPLDVMPRAGGRWRRGAMGCTFT